MSLKGCNNLMRGVSRVCKSMLASMPKKATSTKDDAVLASELEECTARMFSEVQPKGMVVV
jgi:hypothetical protein